MSLPDKSAALAQDRTFPFYGGTIYASEQGNRLWGPNDTAPTGTGIALAAYDGPSGYGGCLRMGADGGKAVVRSYKPAYIPADVSGSVDERVTAIPSAGVYHAFRLTSADTEPTNGTAIGVLDFGLTLDVEKRSTGYSVRLRQGATSLARSRDFPLGTEVHAYVAFTSTSARLETRFNAETAWTVDGDLTGQTVPGMDRLKLQCAVGGTTAAAVIVDHLLINVAGMHPTMPFAPAPEAAKDVEYMQAAGSGCRSAGIDRAIFALVMQNETWAGATQWRVAGDVVSPWQTLTYADQTTVHKVTVTGLVGNRSHAYRFEVRNGSGAVVWQSSDYRMHTLPPEGRASKYHAVIESCAYGAGMAHPYAQQQGKNDAMAETFPVMLTRHMGDQSYESHSLVNYEDNVPGVHTIADFDNKLREWAMDPFLWRQFRVGTFEACPDDHEVINGADAKLAPGQVDYTTPATTYRNSQNTYPSGVTAGDLWHAGLDCHAIWWPCLHYEAGVSPFGKSKRYGVAKFGLTWRVSLDSRWERLDTEAQMLSAEQRTWLDGQITAFGASAAKLLILDSGGVFGPVYSVPSSQEPDGWAQVAPAEYQAFIDKIKADVPTGKSVVMIGGDKHVGYSVSQVFKGGSGVIAAGSIAPLLADVVSSGMMNRRYYKPDDLADASPPDGRYSAQVLDYYKPASNDMGDREMIRTSGILFTVDEQAGTVRLRCWGRQTGEIVLDRTLAFHGGPNRPADDIDAIAPGRYRYAAGTLTPV